LLFCNEEEAKIFTQKEELPDIVEELRQTAGQFVITRGSDGASIYNGETTIHILPEQAEVVDTNGAGDMFAGCYLYGITHGMPAEKAGKLANLAGARVVSTYGPRLEESELKQLLAAVS